MQSTTKLDAARVSKAYSLKQISPDSIDRNPNNPRIYFRTEELNALMASISEYGIQVPITLYEDNGKYILIDGERRWRCALKLNLRRIPALIQAKPTELENLLMMFNIHALREQWDYFTIAIKLPEVIDLYIEKHGYSPNETELSKATGLTRSQIRRCRLLMELPDQYKETMIKELELPKREQKLTEDFFLEMEKALKTINNRLPSLLDNIDEIRSTLIEKYRNNIIRNVTDFRLLSKMATSVERLNISKQKVNKALKRIFNKNKIGITEIFKEQFEIPQSKETFNRYIIYVNEYIEYFINDIGADELDEKLIRELKKLRKSIDNILGK